MMTLTLLAGVAGVYMALPDAVHSGYSINVEHGSAGVPMSLSVSLCYHFRAANYVMKWGLSMSLDQRQLGSSVDIDGVGV